MRQGRVVRSFLMTALIAVACGGGGGPTDPGPSGCPTTIGPSGGTACLGTQFSASFPPGALAQETPITITATGMPADLALEGGIGQAYRLGPAGTAISVPTRITINVPASALGNRSINEVTLRRSTTANALAPAGVELTNITRSPNGDVSGNTTQMGVFAAAFANRNPTASAGSDQMVQIGSTVNLAGTGTDADGDALTFTWAFVSRPAGSAAALSSTSTANTTFVADVGGTYDLRLTVNDGHGGTATDEIRVTASGQANRAPIANAGVDTGAVLGVIVNLNGNGSSDPDGNPLTYSWTFVSQPAGSVTVLGAANTPNAAFTPDVVGVYEIRLTVSDGQLSASDEVRITAVAQNRVPTLNVTAPDGIFIGGSAQITANASDPDNDPLSFSFIILDNPGGGTITQNGNTATFEGGMGVYSIRVSVNDGFSTVTQDIVIVVNPNVSGNYGVTVFVDPTSCGEPTQTQVGTLPVLQPTPTRVILDLPSASADFQTQLDGRLEGQNYFFQGPVRVSTSQGEGTFSGVVSGQIRTNGQMNLNFSFPIFGSCTIVGTINGTKN